MKKTHIIFLTALSVLNLMALITPAHADESLSFDTGFNTGFETGFDTGFKTGFDTGFKTGFEHSDASESESASGSSSAQSILAVGVGALLLSQVGKKGKSSGKEAANNGFLSPTPAPKPTPAPTPSPSPSPAPPPLSLGPPTALTPEMPAGVQVIPVLLAVGGMTLYQRKKKSG